jgi:hypothetical protein
MNYDHGCPDYLTPGGANLENFQISRGGGKLIGFNGQFLAKSPKFCFKYFFNKNHNFLKIFAKFYWNLKGGTKGNISKFSLKNFLWSPLQGFFSTQVKISFGFPLRFSLKFLKKSRGVNFTLVPPLRFFPKKIFQGGATPPSGLHWLWHLLLHLRLLLLHLTKYFAKLPKSSIIYKVGDVFTN